MIVGMKQAAPAAAAVLRHCRRLSFFGKRSGSRHCLFSVRITHRNDHGTASTAWGVSEALLVIFSNDRGRNEKAELCGTAGAGTQPMACGPRCGDTAANPGRPGVATGSPVRVGSHLKSAPATFGL